MIFGELFKRWLYHHVSKFIIFAVIDEIITLTNSFCNLSSAIGNELNDLCAFAVVSVDESRVEEESFSNEIVVSCNSLNVVDKSLYAGVVVASELCKVGVISHYGFTDEVTLTAVDKHRIIVKLVYTVGILTDKLLGACAELEAKIFEYLKGEEGIVITLMYLLSAANSEICLSRGKGHHILHSDLITKHALNVIGFEIYAGKNISFALGTQEVCVIFRSIPKNKCILGCKKRLDPAVKSRKIGGALELLGGICKLYVIFALSPQHEGSFGIYNYIFFFKYIEKTVSYNITE